MNQLCRSLWKRKWIEVNDLSGGKNSIIKNIRFKTPMLGSDLCDYSNVFIVVNRKNNYRRH